MEEQTPDYDAPRVRCWVCPDSCPVGDCQRDARVTPPGVNAGETSKDS